MRVTRRHALGMLAAGALCPSISGCDGRRESKGPFYLWLHGIFSISVEKYRVVLVSPNLQTRKDNLHLYAVGRIRGVREGAPASAISTYKGLVELKDINNHNTYEIVGLHSANPTQFDFREVAALSSGTVNRDANGLFVELKPPPSYVLPMRFLLTAFSPSGTFETDANLLPLLHVLIYDGCDSRKISVLRKYPDGRSEVYYQASCHERHLHIFAEPPPDCANTGACHDPNAALKELIDCFKGIPYFTYEAEIPDVVELENTLGMAADLREQFSLTEWYGMARFGPQGISPASGPQATIRPLNCPQFLVLSPGVQGPTTENRIDPKVKITVTGTI